VSKFSLARACSGLAIVSALATAMPALAQDSSEGQAAQQQTGIGTITVTARRQSESVQDAALAIDAVGAEALEDAGVTTAVDITRMVPAVTFVNGGGTSTSVYLRGVGAVTNNHYLDSAVVSSYDGIPLGRGDGVVGAAFYDLQRVEVLKGPQGILYGRNATGGALNIIPAQPELGRTGAGINASYGNFDAISLNGYLNLATSDNSALRIAGTYEERDGYNRDGSDDLERAGFRAQFLIEPTDTLTVRIGGDYTHLGGVGPGSQYFGAYAGTTFTPSGLPDDEGMFTADANAYRQSVLGAPGFGFLDPMQENQHLDAEFWGVNAEIGLETGIGDFTFITAYRESSNDSSIYGPGFNNAVRQQNAEQFSAELRLAGEVGIVDYIVGGFFIDESVGAEQVFNQEFVLPMQNYTGGTTSWAGFGQLTVNVSDQFRLVGGLRYTQDDKEIDGNITNFITFCGPNAPPPVTPPASFGLGCQLPGALPHYPSFTQPQDALDWLIAGGWVDPASTLSQLPPFWDVISQNDGVVRARILHDSSTAVASGSFDRVTWKLGAEFDITPDNLLYASVETGYRAGGFQLASGNETYNPEYITAYTIGSKNTFFNNRLQVNLEAFMWRYRDQLITYFTVDNNGVLINATQNVGRSDINGFDVDVVARPFPNTTLSGKVQYLDTEYQDLTLITAPPRTNYGCPGGPNGSTTNTGAPVFEFDCSGMPLLYSPTWTVNLGAEQIFDVSDSLELVAAVNTAYRDEQWGGFNFLPEQLIPGYWTTGATLTLRDIDNGWRVQAYVNNIEDERRIALPQASPIGFITTTLTAPLTYGVRVGAEF